jgi:hypothetical protein
MSTLRSAIDELRVRDLRAISDDELVSYLDELEHTDRFVDAERARTVAELERREVFARDGHLSLASWITSRHGVAPSTAAGHVRLARALEQMPVAAEALASGEVSSSAVTLLASAQEAAPEPFARSEEMLVDAARTLPVTQLRSTVAHWRESADAERAAEDEERRYERRAVSTFVTMDGMVESTVKLAASDGQVYITALRAAEDADVRSFKGPDPRTPAQRRADALVHVCRRFLDSSDRPTVAGERPHVIVTVDIETLEGRDGGKRCELADVGRITAEEALMWACDCQVTRVITDAKSRPLDVGRTTRIVPPYLRRALIVRDRGCAFPGCDRPPSWTDAHHVRHWVRDLGPTALDNLALLCRRHHRLIHHRKFSVQMVERLPVFYRADGTLLEVANRAPP